MYTIKNLDSGELLKYLRKDGTVIFNGGENARSEVICTCKKEQIANKFLTMCKNAGFYNCIIKKIDDIEKKPKVKKVKDVEEKDIHCESLEGTEDYDESLFDQLNEKCIKCVYDCKQSYKADVLRCPQCKQI